MILDHNGAESLLGQGDMLFSPVGSRKLQRIQGAYIDEEQIAELTEAWRRQGEPEFHEELLEEVASEDGGRVDDDAELHPDEDPLLEEAIALVAQMGTASTSMLQRRLRLGYTRAGRLIDMLERRGHHLRLRGLQAAPGADHRGRRARGSCRTSPRPMAPSSSGARPPSPTTPTTATTMRGDARAAGRFVNRLSAGSLVRRWLTSAPHCERRGCAREIDISEVEARTKIRAKYLRAIENEEWDLLPGPSTSRASCAPTASSSGSTAGS